MGTLSSRENLYFQTSLAIYGVGVGVSQSLMSLGSVLLMGFFLYQLFQSLRRRTLWTDTTGLERMALAFMGSYVVWLLGVWLWGPLSETRETKGLELFPLVLIPLISLLPQRVRPSDRVLWLSGLALVISCATALYQGFVEMRMAVGFMKSPIYLAYNLLFPFVALSLISTRSEILGWKSPWVPRLCIGLLSLIYLALIATNSRMTFVVATLVGLGVLVPWAWKRFPKIYLLLIAGLVAGFATSEYVRKPYVRQRLAAVTNLQDPSWQGRLKAWEHNLGLIAEHPITGVGPKQNALRTIEHPEWQGLWGPDVAIFAHSIYLQALAESGVVGLVFLLLGFVCLGLSRPLTSGVLVALAMGGLTENILSNSKSLHSFIFCLLVMALLSRPKVSSGRKNN